MNFCKCIHSAYLKIIQSIFYFFHKKETKNIQNTNINSDFLKILLNTKFFNLSPCFSYCYEEYYLQKIFDNLITKTKYNYYGTIVVNCDLSNQNKMIVNGNEIFINLLILLKVLYDCLDNYNKKEYNHFFCNFFVHTKSDGKKYYKFSNNFDTDQIITLINYKNSQINQYPISEYKKINDFSGSVFRAYKFLFEKLSVLPQKDIIDLIEYLKNQNNKMVLFSRKAENNTFKQDNSISNYNACVGTNGWNDSISYIDGYKYAVEKIYKDLKPTYYDKIDCLVYPICFNARHFIELFLKYFINIIHNEIKRIFELNENIDDLLKTTHDLTKLYNLLLSKADNFDIRIYNEISKLQEYIHDFSEHDLTGETFRYPYNQDNEHSLDNLSCINLKVFFERFTEITDIYESSLYLIRTLCREYSTNTFVKNSNRVISRECISNISYELPNIIDWKKPNFTHVKEDIKKKYKISSNTLTKVINIIKNNPEFSIRIGISNKISKLTKEKFELYKIIATQGDIEDTSPDVCNAIYDIFTIEELSIFQTYLDISDDYYYSEEFSSLYNNVRRSHITDFIRHLFYSPDKKIRQIEKGIKKCGQHYLL